MRRTTIIGITLTATLLEDALLLDNFVSSLLMLSNLAVFTVNVFKIKIGKSLMMMFLSHQFRRLL
jgi:hypothetical protein